MRDRVFRDPVHGLIELRGEERPIAELLETRALQRLRRIHQMGLAWLVYPGAEHSRFSHALGALHVAQRVTRQLKLDGKVALDVKVAALLHDVGHGPFSHAWEHVFPGCDHERWGERIVAEDAELAAALEALAPGLAATVRSFWHKQYRPAFARKLVSSQLDVDRLDYLLRDGHFSGAGYATYDLDWILHALAVEDVRAGDDDPRDLVIDYRRGTYAVEQYLFARSYMYAQVYHHKTVRAAEWMLVKLFERYTELARAGAEPPGLAAAAALARGESLAVEGYLRLHDVSVLHALDTWGGRGEGPAADDPVVRDLAARLVDRRLFKTFDLGDDPQVAERVAEPAAALAARRFGAAARTYVTVDTTRQIGYVPRADEELHVVGHPRHGAVTLGRLLEDMPLGQPTATVRLVCAPELVDELRPLVAAALGRAPAGRP
ncbi:MAG: HD domain-containing protein [Kofleriaceae bacterium]|nr:HD domain-containing protein [Kofleriaceae bacterium]MCL4228619.1 HD domain-containing protein [Myxococcales bacterium]